MPMESVYASLMRSFKQRIFKKFKKLLSMTQCIAVALFDFEPFKKDQLALKRRQSVRVLAAVSPFLPL